MVFYCERAIAVISLLFSIIEPFLQFTRPFVQSPLSPLLLPLNLVRYGSISEEASPKHCTTVALNDSKRTRSLISPRSY